MSSDHGKLCLDPTYAVALVTIMANSDSSWSWDDLKAQAEQVLRSLFLLRMSALVTYSYFVAGVLNKFPQYELCLAISVLRHAVLLSFLFYWVTFSETRVVLQTIVPLFFLAAALITDVKLTFSCGMLYLFLC